MRRISGLAVSFLGRIVLSGVSLVSYLVSNQGLRLSENFLDKTALGRFWFHHGEIHSSFSR